MPDHADPAARSCSARSSRPASRCCSRSPSLTAAIGVLTAASHWLPVNSSTFEVVVIIGMAVGVDYSLFYLRREREERAAGRSLRRGAPHRRPHLGPHHPGLRPDRDGHHGRPVLGGRRAVHAAWRSARSPWSASRWSARSPCCPGCSPGLARRRTPAGSRSSAAAGPPPGRPGCGRRSPAGWSPGRWSGAASRRVALLALAAPALGLRLGEPAVDAPKAARRGPDDGRDRAGVPAGPGARRDRGHRDGRHRAAGHRRGGRAPCPRGVAGGPIREPVTVTAIGGGRALLVGVPLAGNGDRHRVRQRARDAAEPDPARHARQGARRQLRGGRRHGRAVRRHPPGCTPACPWCSRSSACSPSSCCSRRSGRSTVPLVSIALNLLSVGAAYGLITLIFQDGRLQGPLGYTAFGGIIYWVPLMMFVFLFGISMDYHVFILSRIRELWARGSSPKEAVIGGIASSAGVVTSAALIMAAVFSIFTTLPLSTSRSSASAPPPRSSSTPRSSAASCCPPLSPCSATGPGAARATLRTSWMFPGQPGSLAGWNASNRQRSPSFTQAASALPFGTRGWPGGRAAGAVFPRLVGRKQGETCYARHSHRVRGSGTGLPCPAPLAWSGYIRVTGQRGAVDRECVAAGCAGIGRSLVRLPVPALGA